MALISRKMLKRRPQELGKIKIGGKGAERAGQGGVKYQLPVKYDHFQVTSRARGADGNFVRDDAVHSHPDVGDSPLELAGVLMYETPEENFHSEMAFYKGKTKKESTCDGEVRTELGSGKATPCKKLEGGECPCKPYGRLHLQLWASGHVMGYHTFRTTSWESVNNIQTALQEIFERFGTLFQAPVKLVMYPSEDQYKDGGKALVSTSWKVGLVLAMSLEDAAMRMVDSKRQLDLARGELRLLAGEVLKDQQERDLEEVEDIAGEFFPEEGVEASVQSQETLDTLKEELGVALDADYEVVGAEGESEGPEFVAAVEESEKLSREYWDAENSADKPGDAADSGEGGGPAEEEEEVVVDANAWKEEAKALHAKIMNSVQDMGEDEALATLTKYLRKYAPKVSEQTQEFVGMRLSAGITARKAENDLKRVLWELYQPQQAVENAS
jgi:hypothetical protein